MFTILLLNNRHFWKLFYAMEWCEYNIGHSSRRVKEDEPNFFSQSFGITNFQKYIYTKTNETAHSKEMN